MKHKKVMNFADQAGEFSQTIKKAVNPVIKELLFTVDEDGDTSTFSALAVALSRVYVTALMSENCIDPDMLADMSDEGRESLITLFGSQARKNAELNVRQIIAMIDSENEDDEPQAKPTSTATLSLVH